MKALFVFCLCLVCGLTMTRAQTETLTLKAIKKGKEPKAVMDAIKQDFPKGIAEDLNFLSAKLYRDRWGINFQDNLDGATPDFYQVNIREENEKYTAVYDKYGELRFSKTIIKHAQMPKEVTAAISYQYPDWQVLDDIEKIMYKSGVATEVFKVEIEQDNNFRMLFIDTLGNVLKDFAEIPFK